MSAEPNETPRRSDAQRNRARILSAAEAVFAARGTGASTEEVAREAGVAVGTVFRHFPTKQDLLRAIMKGLLERLTAAAVQLVEDVDSTEGLFVFVEQVVEEAAAKTAVVDLLSQMGTQVEAAPALEGLQQAVGTLLQRAQHTGAARADIGPAEVTALLAAISEGAVHGAWAPDLRRSVLAIALDGLRPTLASSQPSPGTDPSHQ